MNKFIGKRVAITLDWDDFPNSRVYGTLIKVDDDGGGEYVDRNGKRWHCWPVLQVDGI